MSNEEMFVQIADLGTVCLTKYLAIKPPDWNEEEAKRKLTYRVRVFRNVPKTTTSEERRAFLRKRRAVLLGFNGTEAILEQKKDLLDLNCWYISFDTKFFAFHEVDDFLPQRPLVPMVGTSQNGRWRTAYGHHDERWSSKFLLLVFTRSRKR